MALGAFPCAHYPARLRTPVDAPHLVALVRAGAVFKNGKLIERPDGSEGGDKQVA
jgi:hypothetical protein